ncbi:hypothetical protein [Deinococcus aquaticus]|uniref:hypothetical protein n=1 Tax=Deinococcus aquaticus TaxID=328692 RepID=UPI0036101322
MNEVIKTALAEALTAAEEAETAAQAGQFNEARALLEVVETGLTAGETRNPALMNRRLKIIRIQARVEALLPAAEEPSTEEPAAEPVQEPEAAPVDEPVDAPAPVALPEPAETELPPVAQVDAPAKVRGVAAPTPCPTRAGTASRRPCAPRAPTPRPARPTPPATGASRATPRTPATPARPRRGALRPAGPAGGLRAARRLRRGERRLGPPVRCRDRHPQPRRGRAPPWAARGRRDAPGVRRGQSGQPAGAPLGARHEGRRCLNPLSGPRSVWAGVCRPTHIQHTTRGALSGII